MASETDSERGLWCAVIAQAITDATQPLPQNGTKRFEVQSARAWIMRPNQDFMNVCHLAGYEADRIRAMVGPRIEAAQQNDTNAAETSRVSRVRNGGRAGKQYEFDGREQPLSEWANEAGINIQTVRGRIASGMSIGDALTTPVNELRGRRRSNHTGGGSLDFLQNLSDQSLSTEQDINSAEI